MKKWRKFIAICLAFIFIAPVFLTGCVNTGGFGGSSGGSSSGGSSGGTGGSSGGSSGGVVPEPSKYIDFEDAITGTRFSYIVDDATKEAEYQTFIEKAKDNTEKMAKDILYRLAGEYICPIKYNESGTAVDDDENSGINMDAKSTEIGYTASDNKYLEGYNVNYDIDFKDYSETGNAIEMSVYDIVTQFAGDLSSDGCKIGKIYYGVDSSSGSDKHIEYTKNASDGNTFDALKDVMVSISPKQIIKLSWQEYTEDTASSQESTPKYIVEVKVVTVANIPSDVKNSVEDCLVNYNSGTQLLTHKVITGGSSQISKWLIYQNNVESLDDFVNANYELLTKAILAILSGKDLTASENGNFANSLKSKTIEELVKDCKHYGINIKNDGTVNEEIKNIVKYVLKYCIGDELVIADQEKIYKYDAKTDSYKKLNNYGGDKEFIYENTNENTNNDTKTNRYNNASLSNLNVREYGIFAQNYNLYSATKSLGDENALLKGYEEPDYIDSSITTYSILASYDNVVANNYRKNPNYFEGAGSYLSNNGFQTTDEGINFAVASDFKNYANTVEVIVSTVCNANLYQNFSGTAKTGDNFVYSYVPNIYDYVQNGLYTALVSNNVMTPSEISWDLEQDTEQQEQSANFSTTGEQHYQSMVIYPGSSKFNKFTFDSVVLTFTSTLGVENLDMFIRYHKADSGFVKFNNNGELCDLLRVNSKTWSIPAGSSTDADYVDDNAQEIDFGAFLQKRCDVENGTNNSVNTSIVGTDNISLITAMLKVFSGVNKDVKSLVLSYKDSQDKDYTNSAYTKSTFFSVVNVTTFAGEKVDIMGYDNKEEEYLELLFATEDGAKFNVAYYLTDFSEIDA